MSQFDFLIQDVFTLLSFLSANEVRPLGSRYLPPSALTQLNALLIVSDNLPIQPFRNSRGRWDTAVRTSVSERNMERVRFIHYLADASHLVARTGAFLKPTPRVAQWLDATSIQRAQVLFHSAFPLQPTRKDDDRWRAFGLPGKHLVSPLASFHQLLDIFRQLPVGHRFKSTTLLKLLALPSFDDDTPEDQPANILDVWLALLQSLEIIVVEKGGLVQLTRIGANLIEHSDAKPFASLHKPKPLHWSKARSATMLPNLIAPLDADPAIVFELGDYATHLATLSSVRQTRRLYQLDETRVRRALDHNHTITQVSEFLERATGDALPRVVADWLYRIGREYGRVTLRPAILLEVSDPTLLTQLTRTKPIRQCIRRTLSPRAVVVQFSQVNRLARHLERGGYHPRVELASLNPAAKQTFDHATLAHLYVSARLTHQLGETIPGSYRPPYSVVQQLEQQLTARDRALADEIVSESANKTSDRRQQNTELSLRYAERKDALLPEIKHAIEKSMPLEMAYHSPYGEGTTHRLVEPLRLEYRGAIAYLIGYCHLAKEERTFRVDRILELTPRPAQTIRCRIVARK